MKQKININTKEFVIFAEKVSELAVDGAVDCTDGLRRWSDKKYIDYIDTEQTEFPTCERKYIKVIDNQLLEMTDSEKNEITDNEMIEQAKLGFFGKRYKITIKLDDLEDGNGAMYKNLQKLFKWCMAASYIFTNSYMVDDVEYLAAYMDDILPKHQKLLDAARDIIAVQDAESVVSENVVIQ